MERLILRQTPYTEGTVMLGDAFDVTDALFLKMVDSLSAHVVGVLGEEQHIYFPYTPYDTVYVDKAGLDKAGLEEIAEKDPDTMYILFSDGVRHSDETEDMISTIYPREDQGDEKAGYTYKNVIMIPNNAGGIPTIQFCLDVLDCIFNEEHVYTPAAMMERKKQLLKKRLENIVTNGFKAEKQTLANDIMELTRSKSHYSDQLMSTIRQLESKQQRLTFLDMTINSKEIQRMLQEMDELSEYSTLKDVRIEGNYIIFVTRELALKEPNNCKRPLGRYTVKLDMVNCGINFTNNYNRINTSTWGRSNKIPHPHCDENGYPCLGNLGGILPELVATKDFLAIWQVLLSFLTSYNPNDSWGKRAKYWDKYDADGKLMPDNRRCKSCGCDLPDDPWEADPDHEDGRQWYECPSCSGIVCPDCARELEGEDEQYCPQCASPYYCYICDTYHGPDTDMHRCAECGNTICDDEAMYNERYDRYFCGDGCEEIWLKQRWEDYPQEHPDYEPEAEENNVIDLDPDEEDPFPPMDEIHLTAAPPVPPVPTDIEQHYGIEMPQNPWVDVDVTADEEVRDEVQTA